METRRTDYNGNWKRQTHEGMTPRKKRGISLFSQLKTPVNVNNVRDVTKEYTKKRRNHVLWIRKSGFHTYFVHTNRDEPA